MALKTQRTKKHKPRKTLLYGRPGIGKSTWASKWPNPIFLCTESGVDDIDTEAYLFPDSQDRTVAINFGECWAAVMDLSSEEHSFRTLVVDTADWLEKLIWKEVVADASAKAKAGKEIKCIDDIEFGRGFSSAAGIFGKFLGAVDSLYAKTGMHVVFLAHSSVHRCEPPDQESYDRYAPKLHINKKGVGVGSLIQEWADEVLFATYKVYTSQHDEGFGRKRSVAVGDNTRVLYTCERPAHLGKNRLGLPEEMTMDFEEYEKYLVNGDTGKAD